MSPLLRNAFATITALAVLGPWDGACADVDVFLGSGGPMFGVGSNSPAAQVPFGLTRVGPDTSGWFDISTLHCGGYYYGDRLIRAFSHTRLVGAGVSDLGTLGVIPVVGSLPALPSPSAPPRPLLRPIPFSHEDETARPGYYGVRLSTGVHAEMTVGGTHSAAHRYAFPAAEPVALVFDVCHTAYVSGGGVCHNATLAVLPSAPASTVPGDVAGTGVVAMEGAVTMRGSLTRRAAPDAPYRVHVAIVVAADAASDAAEPALKLYQDGLWLPRGTGEATALESDKLAAVVTWAAGVRRVSVRVGLSLVDRAGAWRNLRAQAGTRGFDALRVAAERTWADAMAGVRPAESAPAGARRRFSAAVYRALCAPTTYSDADGRYRGADGAVHKWPPADFPAATHFRSDLSLWDTHRTHMPWLQLTRPADAADTLASIATLGAQAGALPRWPLGHVLAGCMTAAHGIVSLGDGLRAGVFPAARAGALLAAAVRQTTDPSVRGARVALEHYTREGFVPAEASSTAASRTLEYAFDDWAVSRIADLAGNASVAAAARAGATNFLRTFKGTLPCPRRAASASHNEPSFDCPAFPTLPYPLEHRYTEGDASQWRWFAPQHPWALIAAWPSPAAFSDELDEFFKNSRYLGEPGGWWPFGNAIPDPHYWAGNEPGLFTAWLFLFAGHPHRTQYWTRWLAAHRYDNGPAGLPGNDDYGTMSAWLLWVSLGLYPAPGSGVLLVGSPALPGASIAVPVPPSQNAGVPCTLRIEMSAKDWAEDAVYVAGVRVNGAALDQPSVPMSELGGSFGAATCDGLSSRDATLEFTMATSPQAWAQGKTPPMEAWGFKSKHA